MARSDLVPFAQTFGLTWTDAGGITRTATEMETSHLLNVLMYIRRRLSIDYYHQFARHGRILQEAPFYYTALRELHKRGFGPVLRKEL